MQAQTPQEFMETYLLNSSKHYDGTAQPGSASLLTEHKLAQSTMYIVQYITVQQDQLYACITLHQTTEGSKNALNFLLMGGAARAELPQKSPPQLALCTSLSSSVSFAAIVVLPNEVQSTAIRLRDGQGFVTTGQLENGAVLFVIDKRLYKPLDIEVLDAENRVLSQKRIV